MRNSIRDIKSTGSLGSANVSIDQNRLLTTCQSIRENLDKLNNSIRLVQLRLVTLSYVGATATTPRSSEHLASSKCSDDLIELCNTSQRLVEQLDELNTKLAELNMRENSISYQIASQQLVYFTSEWYEHLTPKFNETFEMAERLSLDQPAGSTIEAAAATTRRDHHNYNHNQQQQQQQQQLNRTAIDSTDLRVRGALMRLRQSMNENERLIATIANNLEYTRATIETIYDSLQSTKANLDIGEQNTVESIRLVRGGHRARYLAAALLLGLIALGALILFEITGII